LETTYAINVRTDSQIVNGQKFFAPGQGTKLNPNFFSISYLDFNADSYYHAFQANVTKRFGLGLQFQASYTASKSIDTASALDSVFINGTLGSDRQDPFDGSGERALSDFDARQNFVGNFLYDLPFGKGRAFGGKYDGVVSTIISGWSTGGIVTLRSGFPFGVALGFDRAGNGVDNVQSQRPNATPGVNFSDATTGDPMRFVDPSVFQLQPAGFYGNAARNALRGPNQRSFDMTLTKETAITERLKSQFRFEAFNLFNRTNFAPPESFNRIIYTGVDANGNAILNPTFGQLTRTATSSRQLQFGLKLLW
jgi:hypothetical protein